MYYIIKSSIIQFPDYFHADTVTENIQEDVKTCYYYYYYCKKNPNTLNLMINKYKRKFKDLQNKIIQFFWIQKMTIENRFYQ